MNRIINTKQDKCTGCNKCIMVCPIKYANNVTIIDGKRKIEVDESRCIACGKCLKVCDHDAREYSDDLSRFLDDLANGEKISVVVAPSFVTNQYNKYKKVFGYFKSIGINSIYNVAFGADITSWGYVQHLKGGIYQNFLISQPCPTIVNYIERYAPNLIKNLVPIQSPVMSTAIYLKKYKKITDKIAFLSPCIAKKSEIEKESNLGLIDYNIPFEKLCSYVDTNNINIMDYPEVDFDANQNGLGVRFSKAGGLAENVLYYLPDLNIQQIEGPDKVYDYLNFLSEGYCLGNYNLIDILNCDHGCNVGTGACKEDCAITTSIQFSNEILNDKRLKNQSKIEINFEEYDKLFEYFNKTLILDDFIVKYQDKSDKIKYMQPTEEDLDIIFNLLKKNDDESKKINCYSCGYKTCKDMAVAIYNDYNTPLSCYQYNRKEVETQKHISDYIITLLEYLAKAIIVTDEKGFINFINKEANVLLGFSIEDCIHQPIQNFVQNINLEELDETKKKEYKCSMKNGETCDLTIETRMVELQDKKYIIFAVEDITKQKEMENFKKELKLRISHELRTPLTAISGALNIILGGFVGEIPVTMVEMLNMADSNSKKLLELVKDLIESEDFKINY